MGESRNTKELVGKISAYAYAFGKANRKATSSAALRYKEQALRNVTADSGGDRILSNFKSGKVKLGAGYRLVGYNNAKAFISPRPYGVWSILDGGTVPHRITPRGGKRRRKTNDAGELYLGNGVYAPFVEHPGSPGKRTFRKAGKQGERAAKRSFQRSHAASLAEAFK